jgi:hypothetical protein
MVLTLQNLKLGGNLEFSWLIFYPGNCPAQANRKFPVQLYVKFPILVAGTNSVSSGNIVEESFFDKYFAEKLKVPTII